MSFSSQVTCTGTDNLTRTTKRQNTQVTQNNTTKKGAPVNRHTQKKLRLRDRSYRAWFSRLVRHPARKQSGSVFTTLEPATGGKFLEFFDEYQSGKPRDSVCVCVSLFLESVTNWRSQQKLQPWDTDVVHDWSQRWIMNWSSFGQIPCLTSPMSDRGCGQNQAHVCNSPIGWHTACSKFVSESVLL